jgi:hypothetical protein
MEVATNALFMTYWKEFACEYNSINFKLYDIYAWFIQNFNEKVILKTTLMNQIRKYLFITFNIPKKFKFCIQLNINPIKTTMV